MCKDKYMMLQDYRTRKRTLLKDHHYTLIIILGDSLVRAGIAKIWEAPKTCHIKLGNGEKVAVNSTTYAKFLKARKSGAIKLNGGETNE